MQKSKLPYFQNFPDDFFGQATATIVSYALKGQNVQLVGPEGSGKSLLFRSLLKNNNLHFYLFDINLMPDRSYKSLLQIMSEKLNLKDIGKDGKRTVFLFDSFENLSPEQDSSLLSSLKSLYDQNRDFLSFVFSVEKEIGFTAGLSSIYHLPNMSQKDAQWFMDGVGESLNGRKLDKKTKDRIFDVSGGHMATIKRLIEIYCAGEDLERYIEDPGKSPHLAYQLELLIDAGTSWVSPVLKNYLTRKNGIQKPKNILTASEFKIFEVLDKNKGEIVSRDDIIEAVWGKNATRGISDHALDQLIHRLKNKVKKFGIEIATVKGRGHRLV